jgi:pimeloyl-ACP methyl ester carboxylesterase
MNFSTRHTSTQPTLRILEGPRAGPATLLLHGVTRRAEDFQPLWDDLSPGHRLIAPDQRGHGDSQRTASYLVTDYVADAVAIVRDQIAEPVFILGHSLGAMVAAAVAGEVPELVRGVVLEDPPFHTMGRNIHGTAWQAQFIGMRDAALRGGSVEELADMLADIRLPQRGGGFKRLGEMRDRANLLWSAQCLARLDPHVLTPVIEGRWLDGYDITGILAGIRCKTLVLQADPQAGGALVDSDAALCESTIATCRIVRFPGIGHLLHWQQPARIAGLVNELVS